MTSAQDEGLLRDPPPSYELHELENPLIAGIIETNEEKSPLHMAFMNMANSILGAGIISQPFAVREAGVLGAFVVYIALGFLVDWTLRLIVQNLVITGTETYQESVAVALGEPGRLAILLANGLFAFGGCVAFCIIIGDTIPHVLRTVCPPQYIERNWVIIVVTLLISLPLSLSKKIKQLERASFLALVSMAVIVVTVAVRGPFLPSELKSQVSLFAPQWWFRKTIFKSVSIVSFALVCHHNTSFIFHSLRNKSIYKFNRLTHWSCAVSVSVCMLMGYTGFHTFKEKTKGNVLNNFSGDDGWINVARLFFGFNMLTTFPLEIFVLRNVVLDIWAGPTHRWYQHRRHHPPRGGHTATQQPPPPEPHGSSPARGPAGPHPGLPPDPEPSEQPHTAVTVVLVLATMGVALVTCNLGALLEVIGSTTGALTAYILPPLTHVLLTRRRPQPHTARERLGHCCCVVFGCTVMLVSTTQTLLDWSRSAGRGGRPLRVLSRRAVPARPRPPCAPPNLDYRFR
ncbi:Avt2p KNAG_0C00780 [Huiozyma naganishii CBS 8797]|uniref:Amino acid transporter transmembrane domain-containing protein n=1 Tax=Huiozyma naganishii (strain ATCC MYA-139 / BCRC 22969 / CBS 8797 / KCTC 17520 / NBRC 10181 / NCYC 3082 / Yp74L-3) TaxID=1071383 RepID=J7S5J7_HUIN7|nr:hypothetical protein KNAG_0C00780 [Kazachstania naganishii CBS 8797]CCK69191.1 hypothetical protein KNAG_0C00780 [Kazachstania naganishii CBS 8797]